MKPELKQRAALIPSMALRQALKVLQLPVYELAIWLAQKIEQNPVLHLDEGEKCAPVPDWEERELDFEKSRFEVLEGLDEAFAEAVFDQEEWTERQPLHEKSLYEALMSQASEAFSSPEELKKAEEIIGNLDERGFLGDHPADPAILKVIQTFDPPGIAARDLQHSLLLQLDRRGKKESLAYFLVARHFSDLLQNKLPKIQAETGLSTQEMQTAFSREIALCEFSPAGRFTKSMPHPLAIDIFLRKEGDSWHIEINDTLLPSLQLRPPPLAELAPAEQKFVRAQITEGKELLEALSRRRQTLEKIVVFLLAKQAAFFNGQRRIPMSMRAAAGELGLHSSTVARAVRGKIVSCPRGIFPLRSFFSSALGASSGTLVSSQTAKELLRSLVEQEDKSVPLSDDALSLSLARQGIACARRTIAKYRTLLGIPAAQLRKKWL